MSAHEYTVVVGVSPRSSSPTALLWARRQAREHGGRLVALRAWKAPTPQATPSGTTAARVPRSTDSEHEAFSRLVSDVAEVLGPDHGAELVVTRGDRRRALLAAARDADLLVVDAPRSLAASPLFAHRLVYAAPCPVVVMPPRISGEPETGLARASRAAGAAAVRAAGTAGRPGLGTRRT
ncbi:universal stress protein [Phycicoccus flavus]|uniref:universal stress protein n=1 Tax=Phycicoccus flavus TaxID=2502783 RepID=UPI000FEB75B5|nr:universal stress protein [Phycicoccus flavus]NHA67585.1 universal stress protein [Phycicoccus flavus]